MGGTLRFLVWVGFFAAIVYVIGWAFLFEAHTAPDNSMAPNIIRGDKFLVYKLAHLGNGYPALCSRPNEPGTIVVGRVIAQGGDKISLNRTSVYLNDSQLEQSVEGDYVLVDDRNTEAPQTVELSERIETLAMIRYRILWPKQGDRRARRRRMKTRVIDDDEFFLLADNRAFGTDSRVYGPVEISSCIGRPLLIYHPAESSGDAGRQTRWFNIIR